MSRVVEKDYERALHSFVDDVYKLACDEFAWSWGDLAKHAGLSYQTVYRLGMRHTRLPQDRTTFRLAKAVGRERQLVKITVTHTHLKLRKVG